MIKKFLFFTFIWMSTLTSAQIHEVGVQFGGSNYIGDIGPTNYIWPNNYAFGVIYKYNYNPRIAMRAAFTYFEISSDDADSKNVGRQQRNLHFNNSIYEFATGIEFSWFEYNIADEENTHTPYILLEIAAFKYNVVKTQIAPDEYQYQSTTSVSIPFGLGYKTKLFGKFALGAEIGVRYTFKDNIDYNFEGINDLEFGNPNNNDWYVFSGINLVYTFGRPPCYATRTF